MKAIEEIKAALKSKMIFAIKFDPNHIDSVMFTTVRDLAKEIMDWKEFVEFIDEVKSEVIKQKVNPSFYGED